MSYIELTISVDSYFVQNLDYRFKRSADSFICDIYDGKLYSKFAEFYSSPLSISLLLNYDGAPKFKSSNMQIWPVQMCINELPPHLRYACMYICVCVCVCVCVCACVRVCVRGCVFVCLFM